MNIFISLFLASTSTEILQLFEAILLGAGVRVRVSFYVVGSWRCTVPKGKQ